MTSEPPAMAFWSPNTATLISPLCKFPPQRPQYHSISSFTRYQICHPYFSASRNKHLFQQNLRKFIPIQSLFEHRGTSTKDVSLSQPPKRIPYISSRSTLSPLQSISAIGGAPTLDIRLCTPWRQIRLHKSTMPPATANSCATR